MFKKTALTLALAFTLNHAGTAGDNSTEIDAIVANINGEIITLHDVRLRNYQTEMSLASRFRDNGPKLREAIKNSRKVTANSLIEQKLVLNEFKQKQFQVPITIIEQRIDRIIRERSGGDREGFEKKLTKSGQTMEELRETIKDNVAVELMLNQFVYRTTPATNEMISNYFQTNIKLWERPPSVNFSILLVSEAGKTEAEHSERLNKVSEFLKTGTFEDAVTKYSEDTYSKRKGGNLGWMAMPNVLKDFRPYLVKMKKGEISKVVNVGEKSYFLYLKDISGDAKVELTPVIKKQIKQRLRQQTERKQYKEFIDKLKAQSIITIYFE